MELSFCHHSLHHHFVPSIIVSPLLHSIIISPSPFTPLHHYFTIFAIIPLHHHFAITSLHQSSFHHHHSLHSIIISPSLYSIIILLLFHHISLIIVSMQ